MCGIAGYWAFESKAPAPLEKIIQDMTQALQHRGPDDEGFWTDEGKGVALGHRRLSILDLSQAGHQPMTSGCGRYVVIYNGEIYNFLDLKKDLRSHNVECKGSSDTQVLVQAIATWGLPKTLKKLRGMYAFALYDRQENVMTLVRDPIGIKPLYWTIQKGALAFGSELRPIIAAPVADPQISQESLQAYLRHNYVPAPMTIYEGIFKLEPGHILTLHANGKTHEQKFWTLDQDSRNLREGPLSQRTLKDLLLKVVERHMVSDVPLGAFLSGGLDSTLVTALMQEISANPIKTFTIGFKNAAYNESPYATKIAQHLGTDHYNFELSEQDALDIIPNLPQIYDEPFADSSQIPTYLVSKCARQHVTVALSGDGGDEVFGGYNRYLFAQKYLPIIQACPAPLRKLIAKAPQSFWRALPLNTTQMDEKIHKIQRMLNASSQGDIYQALTTFWQDQVPLQKRLITHKDRLVNPFSLDPTRQFQYWDYQHYLPDDILTKVDRASMAVGLEARVPLLDLDVVETLWAQPTHRKIKGSQTKVMIRKLLENYVPTSYFKRPKMGFSVPIDQWLRGPLRPWAQELLSQSALQAHGLLDETLIQKVWSQHLHGTLNAGHDLWGVLMFQGWHQKWHSGA